jgi:hypothetical protein
VKEKRALAVWERDPELATCRSCSGPIERERLVHQGGRTKFCASCAPEQTAERLRVNREARKAKFGALKPSTLSHMVASDLGALAELQVSADLLRRGFHVFRAVSPAASCDLVAMRGEEILRIEVKSARRYACGVQYNNPKDRSRFDVLALAVEGEGIEYRPSLDSDDAPEHPNYRAQFDRIEGVPV